MSQLILSLLSHVGTGFGCCRAATNSWHHLLWTCKNGTKKKILFLPLSLFFSMVSPLLTNRLSHFWLYWKIKEPLPFLFKLNHTCPSSSFIAFFIKNFAPCNAEFKYKCSLSDYNLKCNRLSLCQKSQVDLNFSASVLQNLCK